MFLVLVHPSNSQQTTSYNTRTYHAVLFYSWFLESTQSKFSNYNTEMNKSVNNKLRGCHGCDRMVVGLTTTYAICNH